MRINNKWFDDAKIVKKEEMAKFMQLWRRTTR